MSFVPLRMSQLEFIADEFWPGGGENDDGRDLTGVAKHEGVWREETTDEDLIAEALHPSDADYYDRHRVDEMDDEEFEKWCDEDDADEEDNNYLDVLDAQWLAEARAARDADGDLDGDDGPDSLELARTAEITLTRQIAIDPWCVVVPRRWNASEILNGERDGSELEDDGIVPSGPGVATALERFERDGIRQIGSRLAADMAAGWMAFERKAMMRRWNDTPKPWKRQRQTQYRLRQICPRITDPAYRDAA